MGKETDLWPFIPAKFFQAIPRDMPRHVRVIVVHDMEYPERMTAAEDVARYFQTMPDNRKASAHICVDADSIVQCVKDSDIAYAAPGCNADGIQIELAGYARQSRDEWLDTYGLQLLDRAGDAIAQYCIKYDMIPRHLKDIELKRGERGIVGHDQVSRVYQKSTHADPGPNFPWDVLMANVHWHYQQRMRAP